MTLDDVDALLSQWAAWSANELKSLNASRSKWQSDYRSSYDPEHSANQCEAAPDELQMLDVDMALSLVKIYHRPQFQILKGRYVYGHAYSIPQLDDAKHIFRNFYLSPFDSRSDIGLNTRQRASFAR